MKKVYVTREAEGWEQLHNGAAVVTGYRPNQEGEITPCEWIELKNGKIICTFVCWSSWDHGFGTCHCYSHPSEREEEISWSQASGLIRMVVHAGPPWEELNATTEMKGAGKMLRPKLQEVYPDLEQ